MSDLYSALSQNVCKSYDDIALVTGWSKSRVATSIVKQRLLAAAGLSHWTIPHQARGKGDHLFFPVATDGSTILSPVHNAYLFEGVLSTLRHIMTMGDNEAQALKIAANYVVDMHLRQAILALADSLTQAADIAEDAASDVESLV